MSMEELMKAVDAGIAEAGESPASEVDDSEDETLPEGEETPDEGGEPEDETPAEGEETPDEGDESEGDETPPEGEGKPEPKPGEQPASDDKGDKEPDPVEDPIDPRLTKKTKKRIESLVDRVRDTSTERDAIRAKYDEHINHIQATGATPQQYGDALSYLKLVNSGDPSKMEQALQIMQGEVQALAKMLGKPVPGVSLLQDHPDLMQQVQAGHLSQQAAEELAGHRTRSTYQTARTAQQREQEQTRQAADAEVQRGVTALDALGQRLAQENPQEYAAKKAVLVESLKPVFAQIRPSEWAATFEAAYRRLTVATPVPTPRPAIPAQQPLRVKTPAGGQKPEPKNLQDSIMNIDFSKV